MHAETKRKNENITGVCELKITKQSMNQLTLEIGVSSTTENLSDVQWKCCRSSHVLQDFQRLGSAL